MLMVRSATSSAVRATMAATSGMPFLTGDKGDFTHERR